MARSTPADARHRQLAASPLSFAKRKEARRMQKYPPGINESSGRMSGIVGNAPGHGIANSRSVYFEDVFQAGRKFSPAKDLIVSEAMVAAEVRTNVIVGDECGFVRDMAHQLSIRYQKSISSVVVTLDHGVCMLFADSFDPAYTMSVSALPSDVTPTKNKRNAYLIQHYMEDCLGVATSRGFLRFVSVSEESAAWGGNTVAGQIELASGRIDHGTRALRTTPSRRLSVKSFISLRSSSVNSSHATSGAGTPSDVGIDLTTPSMATVSEEHENAELPGQWKAQSNRSLIHSREAHLAERKKSITSSIFGWSPKPKMSSH